MPRHPTQKELIALRVLSGHPDGLFGLQLVAESEDAIRRGSVYFVLQRLKEAGFVESRPEPPPVGYGGKLRHIFTISALGQEVLDHEEQFAGLGSPEAALMVLT